MGNLNPAHVVLANVRLSYVNLTTPKAGQDGDEPKYSAVVLVPKYPEDNKRKIDVAIRAATEKARAKFGAAFPVLPKNSVRDGDGVRPSDGQPFGDECRGCWVFTASSRNRPQVVDGNLQSVLDSTQLYSGIYVNIGVTFFGYNAPQNKGVGVGLETVQKIADGEPLGGVRTSAEDDFAIVPAPSQQPQYTMQQPQYTMQQPQYTMQQPQYTMQQPQYNAPFGVDPITGAPYQN